MASNKKALSAIEVGTGDEDSLSYSQDGEQSMYAQPQPIPHIRPYYSGAYQNRPLLYTMHFFLAFVSRMWDFGIGELHCKQYLLYLYYLNCFAFKRFNSK